MVSSLDGYIAKRNGDVSWMETNASYESGVSLSEEEISEFLEKIDCYIMGSKTYLNALELGWPYGDKPVFVVTSQQLESNRPSVQFFSGDLESFVRETLSAQYSNIWMVGGANLTRQFIRGNLGDEIVITILPILLGDGIPFFNEINKEVQLHLKDVKGYKNGLVEMHYEIIKY